MGIDPISLVSTPEKQPADEARPSFIPPQLFEVRNNLVAA